MDIEIRLGTPTDYITLCAERYLYRGLDMPTPVDGATRRVVAGELQIVGSSPDDLWGARQAVQHMLERAWDAFRQRLPATERVSLQLKLGTTGWTYADVVSGTLGEFEHHPTGISAYCTLTLTCLPLLRTDAVTAENLLVAPCDPTTAAWTRTNVTATADVATAPDGSLTAARLRETVATGTHEVRQQITKPATPGQYTGSVYVKPDGRTAVALYLADSGGTNGAYAGFSLVGAGSLLYPPGVSGSGFSGPAATITDAGGGWYRVWLTATSNADTGLRLYAQCHNGASTSYAGDTGKGLLVWGAQLEEGATAGLLLVPTTYPDTVVAENVVPAYWVDDIPESDPIDPDNLTPSATTNIWDTFNSSVGTTTKPGTATTGTAYGFWETTATAAHYAYIKTTGSPSYGATVATGVNTLGIYLRAYGSSTQSRVLFSGNAVNEGYYVTVDFSAGTVSSPTLRGGSGYSGASSEIIALSGGWFWVRITQTMNATSTAGVYVTYRDSSAGTSYAGNTNYGVRVYAPQIVAGAVIDKPTAMIPGHEVPEVVTPATTTATGRQAGAYLWPVPGDAEALYRLELADESTTVAVNRVHVGGWSGARVRLDSGRPFTLLDAAEGASVSTGGLTQVGMWVPAISPDGTWRTIGTIDDTSGLPPGRYDAIARVRDTSVNMSPPTLAPLITSGSVYATQIARKAREIDPDGASVTLTDIPQTRPGSTLILMAQAMCQIGTWGDPDTSATVTGGGLTWSSLIPTAPPKNFGRFQAWIVQDAPASIGSSLTVTWSRSIARGQAAVTLIEVTGVSATSLDKVVLDVLDYRTGLDLESGTATLTPAEAGGIAISAGLGWNDWANPFTMPTTDGTAWYSVSSLMSGAIYARSIPTTSPISSRWRKVQVIGMFPDPAPEGWLNALVLLKAAVPTGSSIGTGQWSVVVTAISADGVESLPSSRQAASVVSSGSAVTVSWDPPQNGTAAKYRVYRNRGSGWGYVEVNAPKTAYTFRSETGLTSVSPPTSTSPMAALRLAVSPPSGRTLAVGRSTSAGRANGIWEIVPLGAVTVPPVASGEGPMPDGWQLHVQARNSATYPVQCNGLWLLAVDDGQAQAWRVRQNATIPRDWVLDTSRDELTTAVLLDGTDDAGQVALVPGALTIRPGGGAHLSVRADVVDGVSDLVGADLRVTRVQVTPRWRYLAPGGG